MTLGSEEEVEEKEVYICIYKENLIYLEMCFVEKIYIPVYIFELSVWIVGLKKKKI